ncbi:hypothetical protein D3C77_623380 [compost metagenome]
MLASLRRSRWLNQQIQNWGTVSLTSRWHVVGTIRGAMLYPSFGVRRGLLDADEVRCFPLPLRRRMVMSAWLSITGFVWMMLAVGLLKLTSYQRLAI